MKLKKGAKVIPYSPTKELLDENFIGLAIMECLKNDDPEGVIEVIQAHLNALNKARFSKAADLPRSTMYHLLKSKNPTIKTLAKLVHACARGPERIEEKNVIHSKEIKKAKHKFDAMKLDLTGFKFDRDAANER